MNVSTYERSSWRQWLTALRPPRLATRIGAASAHPLRIAPPVSAAAISIAEPEYRVSAPRQASRIGSRLPAPVQRAFAWTRMRLTPPWLVSLLAMALSIASYAWYASQGLVLGNSDAIGHQAVARAVFTATPTGLAQLGGVWLPLHHIFMLPLIWNDYLWQTGFAGTLPSMVSYVLSGLFLYRLGVLLTGKQTVGWGAALILLLNPSALYMQATPMSELEMLATAILAVYYTAAWARAFAPLDLVKAALAAAAGTLIRYEGWALALGLVVCIVIIAWQRRERGFTEASLILFSALGFAGCVAWLIYQQVIFGNALYFLFGPYSAHAQNNSIKMKGGLPTYHNPLLSLEVFGTTAAHTIGWPLAIVTLIGIVAWLFASRLRSESLPLLALLAPFAFDWFCLATGVITIQIPDFSGQDPTAFFNERYGMVMIPAAAIFIALLITNWRLVLPLTMTIALLFGVISMTSGKPYALQEVTNGAAAHTQASSKELGGWLSAHAENGSVLLSSGPFAPTIFYIHIDPHNIISETSGPIFKAAIAHPEQSAQWIVVDPQSDNYDPVWATLSTQQDWRSHYILRQTVGTALVYERIGGN